MSERHITNLRITTTRPSPLSAQQAPALMTIDATGTVTPAEVLTGPKALRETAIEALKLQTYRPVLRGARPVSAYIGQAVNFTVEGKSSTSPLNISDKLEAVQRLRAGGYE